MPIIGGGTVTVVSGDAAPQRSNYRSGTSYEANGVVSAAPATLYGLTVYNNKASALYLQLYNATAVPATGTQPDWDLVVPAQASVPLFFGVDGKYFSSGISWANSTSILTRQGGSTDFRLTAEYA